MNNIDNAVDDETPEERQHAIHHAALEDTGFWGRQAAGCLFLAKDTGRILFAHRSDEVLEPHTWGTWGGAIDEGEDPAAAVRREVQEEAGYDIPFRLLPLVVFKHESGFRYHNFLAIVGEEFVPELNRETQDYVWVDFGSWPSPLHQGATFLLAHSASTIKMAIREL